MQKQVFVTLKCCAILALVAGFASASPTESGAAAPNPYPEVPNPSPNVAIPPKSLTYIMGMGNFWCESLGLKYEDILQVVDPRLTKKLFASVHTDKFVDLASDPSDNYITIIFYPVKHPFPYGNGINSPYKSYSSGKERSYFTSNRDEFPYELTPASKVEFEKILKQIVTLQRQHSSAVKMVPQPRLP